MEKNRTIDSSQESCVISGLYFFWKAWHGAVLQHIVLEAEVLWKYFFFTFIVSEEKQKEQNCPNLTMTSCFAAYFLGAVSTGVVALSNCPPGQLYTRILPLSRLVFCISLKGTFMGDIKRAEAFLTFPMWLLPAGLGRKTLPELELQAAELLPLHYAYRVHWKDSTWHVWMDVFFIAPSIIALLLFWIVSLLWGKQIFGVYTNWNLRSFQILDAGQIESLLTVCWWKCIILLQGGLKCVFLWLSFYHVSSSFDNYALELMLAKPGNARAVQLKYFLLTFFLDKHHSACSRF